MWSLTLREENRLRVFLRRIFGPKKDAYREWRRLHNEKAELHRWYSSPDIVRMNKSRRLTKAEHVVRMGKVRKQECFQNVNRKPREKKPLGRPRRDGRTILEWMKWCQYLELSNLVRDRDYWSPGECAIKHPGSIRHELVNYHCC